MSCVTPRQPNWTDCPVVGVHARSLQSFLASLVLSVLINCTSMSAWTTNSNPSQRDVQATAPSFDKAPAPLSSKGSDGSFIFLFLTRLPDFSLPCLRLNFGVWQSAARSPSSRVIASNSGEMSLAQVPHLIFRAIAVEHDLAQPRGKERKFLMREKRAGREAWVSINELQVASYAQATCLATKARRAMKTKKEDFCAAEKMWRNWTGYREIAASCKSFLSIDVWRHSRGTRAILKILLSFFRFDFPSMRMHVQLSTCHTLVYHFSKTRVCNKHHTQTAPLAWISNM